MFDVFLEKLKEFFKSRLLPITIIYLLLFGILFMRLFNLQIVNGEKAEQDFETKTVETRDIKGTRGNIYDSNGKLLAYNVLSYSVTLLDKGEFSSNEQMNAALLKLIDIIERNGGTIDLTFGLVMEEDGSIHYRYEGNSLLRFKRDAFSVISLDDLTEEQKNMTAEQMFEFLRTANTPDSPRFEIADTYTKKEAFKILSIRFAIFLNRYQKYVPITIASNVNDKTVASIKEHSVDIPGVDIAQETSRVYTEPLTMSHILGYTGSMTDEKWDEIIESGKDKLYTKNDQIGRTGLEEKFEEYLHGVKGYDTVILNQSKRVVDVQEGLAPVAGNDLYLTIDSELQKAAYTLLEKSLAGILLDKIKNITEAPVVKSAKEIVIPITDVYYSFINNMVIDTRTFSDDNATDIEKSVHAKYENAKSAVYSKLNNILDYRSNQLTVSLTEEYQGYIRHISDLLVKKEILNSEKVNEEDSTFKKYQNEEISMSEFLRYAIGQEWINRQLFSNPETFYDSEEIYSELLNYIQELLAKDTDFNKIIYKNLVFTQKLTGKEICLLLFDQDVLKYDKEAIDNLKSGAISPYNFIMSKIKSLEITPAQIALLPCSGSIVITDTATGKVKTLVTYPSYDNNMLANKIDATYYEKINNSTAFPLINRPLQQRLAPGSTYKMLSAITALQEGAINVGDTIEDKVEFDKILSESEKKAGKRGPLCWVSPRNHGSVDVVHALEVSCNYFFYEVGYRLGGNTKDVNHTLGLNKLRNYASLFGLSEVSGIELGEYKPKISDKDVIRSSIGQGTNNYAPAQLSKYVTGIANSGLVYDLSIIDKAVDINGNVVFKKDPVVYNNIDDIKDSTWNAVHEGMRLVVSGEDSSIEKLYTDLGVNVAGKTGTAQQIKTQPDHALFVSYAPFEAPEITVTTVIPNGYGSSNAAELTSYVYDYYFHAEKREEILNRPVTLPRLSANSAD